MAPATEAMATEPQHPDADPVGTDDSDRCTDAV